MSAGVFDAAIAGACVPGSELADASVLIVLFERPTDGQPSVLLTLRNAHLNSHGGEVSFPGGKRDPIDTSNEDTALREAFEEIGLERSWVRVLGTLPFTLSKHGLTVAPIVAEFVPLATTAAATASGISLPIHNMPASVAHVPAAASIHPFPPLTVNPGEVDAVFSAPLDIFLRAEGHASIDITWNDNRLRMHEFNYLTTEADVLHPGPHRPFRIWGLTARLCIAVAQAVLAREPAFSMVPDTEDTPAHL
eukprot:m.16297 g.16297  ORF g.16297 m.16297 type:complete len:250 (-) comp3123_c0_seq1:28-777(-)